MAPGEWFAAHCVCGETRRGATLGSVQRWADWHPLTGVEGCDHVLWVGYDPPTRATHIRKEGLKA